MTRYNLTITARRDDSWEKFSYFTHTVYSAKEAEGRIRELMESGYTSISCEVMDEEGEVVGFYGGGWNKDYFDLLTYEVPRCLTSFGLGYLWLDEFCRECHGTGVNEKGRVANVIPSAEEVMTEALKSAIKELVAELTFDQTVEFRRTVEDLGGMATLKPVELAQVYDIAAAFVRTNRRRK